MLKQLSILATLVALGAGSANAQQREAVFQTIEVPGANFDIVLATARPGAPLLHYGNQPDPNVIDLGSGLVIAYTPELSEVLDIAALMHGARITVAEGCDDKSRTPAIVYVVPKSAR